MQTVMMAKFLYMGKVIEGKFLGTKLFSSGYAGQIEVEFNGAKEIWTVIDYLTYEVEVGEVKKPKTKVFYESGYQWTVLVEGETESRICGVEKSEAVRVAKAAAKENGGELDIQKLTREERSTLLRDRWFHVKESGYSTLNYR